MKIYRYFTKLKKNVRENVQSTLQSNVTQMTKEDDNEKQIFKTAAILAGWTLLGIFYMIHCTLGWAPFLLFYAYEVSSGIPGNPYWELIGSSLVSISISGDSIILLTYDKRWNASLRDMISELRNKIFGY